MYCTHVKDVEAKPVTAPGVEGVTIQWLLDEQRGAPNFSMRRYVIQPGGCTPWHQHDWEHEVYVLRGSGVVVTEAGETPIGPDTAILVMPNEGHQFRAAAAEPLEFLCLVPNGPATAH